MKRTLMIVALATTAAMSMGQALTPRTFTWGTQDTPGTMEYQGAIGSGAWTTGTGTLSLKTMIQVDPYVYISGNQTSYVEVKGAGDGAQNTEATNAVFAIYTNMNLGFALTAPTIANIPTKGTMSVEYDYQLEDNSSAAIGSPATLTATESADATPASLTLNLTDTTDGVAKLAVTRKVTMNGFVKGNTTYESDSSVVVTVN